MVETPQDNPDTKTQPETETTLESKPETKTETKTETQDKSESKTDPLPQELDFLSGLVRAAKDADKDGTNVNPFKPLFNIPTPPLFVLIEMMQFAKKYVELKVQTAQLNYDTQKLNYETQNFNFEKLKSI